MSEKRFKLDSELYEIYDYDKLMALKEVVDLLNELAEKNEQLKDYFKKRAECSNFQINKLKEEIAELQEDNVDTIVELSKENEQLRNFIELMNMRQKWKLYNYKRDNDE